MSDRSGLFLRLVYNHWLTKVIDASVAKLVDARDLKSLGCKAVPVRLRPEAPQKNKDLGFLPSPFCMPEIYGATPGPLLKAIYITLKLLNTAR